VTKISQLSSIGDSLAVDDQFIIRDVSDVSTPNKSVTVSGITRALDLGTAAAPAIAFASDKNTGIYSPGADQVAISTNGTGRLFVDSAGNVGVGTASPIRKCVISNNGAEGFEFGPGITSNVNYEVHYNRSAAQYVSKQVEAAQHIFNSATGEVARIDSSGRLGLGTSSPGAKLHVAAGANVALQLDADTGLNTSIALSENGSIKWYFGNLGADDSFRFYDNTAATERLRITSAGLVGIGTSTPGGQLEIFRTSTTDPSLRLRYNSTSYYGDHLMDGNGNYIIYSPAANGVTSGNLKLRAGGSFSISTNDQAATSSQLILDSSGRLGIGTAGPSSKLHVLNPSGGSGTTEVSTIERDNSGYFLKLHRNAGSGNLGGLIGADSAGTYYTGGHSTSNMMYIDSGNNLIQFFTNANERARIDSSGRLLVGTSTARAESSITPQFQVEGTSFDTSSFQLANNSNDVQSPYFSFVKSRGTTLNSKTVVQSGDQLGAIRFIGTDGANGAVAASITAVVDGTPGTNDMPGRLVFSVTADGAASPTERMRITEAGAILFNRTSSGLTIPGAGFIANTGGAYGEIVQSNNGVACLYLNQGFGSGTQTAVDLRFNNTQVGTINVSSSATSYNTSSDYRLKENVVSLIGAIDRVNQLQVHRFNFIADPATTVDGFIAHEAQAVVPECVTGTKDAVDADGNPQYQGIDQSKLVPLLTAALQEAITKIETLEARITALESA
jgi:hypothetical protein